MLFNSWEFAVFFAIVLPLYLLLRHRGQNLLLLFASYVFYGWWDARFLALLFATTCVDYRVAIAIADEKRARRRRSLLLLSIVLNLGVLGVFKYFNFFVDSATAALHLLGLDAAAPALRILLPPGISFYTFQEMAYVIDVYRGDVKPARRFWDFALFVVYFPHLVAGPIQVPRVLLPQIGLPRRVTWEGLASGGLLVLIGLSRKILIADWVASRVDRVFSNPDGMTSFELARGVFLFSLQIYCDFAGYTDIARGISRILGIELPENFRRPYFSTNITEFWRRWHISLSTWLRDYLYIPLGGNRGSAWFMYRNLMLTMLLGGLWHGANWTFVAWGGLHGTALVIHKAWIGRRPVEQRPRVPWRILSWGGTMLLVGVAWVFFRAPDFSTATKILTGIAALRGPFELRQLAPALVPTAIVLFIDLPQARRGEHEAILRWPLVPRTLTYVALVVAILLLRTGHDVPFIYFQF